MHKLPSGFGQNLVDWTAHQALPLWSTMGWWDEQACFFETLNLDGTPDRTAPMRVRTQARQIYVYAHAHILGVGPDGLDLARTALTSLRQRAWAPDGRPGWVHVLAPDGSVQNPLRDTYDHAFILHALAWFHRATGESVALDWADETLDYMDTALVAPLGGWAENDTNSQPRRQNPHMHSFEALLALYEASGQARYLARAAELYQLFRTRFFDEKLGVVREFFEPDWRLLPGDASDQLEPGHFMEWVWLLRRYEKACGRPIGDQTSVLLENGRRLGLDVASGFLRDEVYPDGRIKAPTRRLWPQTEYAKALMVEYRAHGDPALSGEAQGVIDRMLASYLTDVPPGGWRDVFDGDGKPTGDRMPASSLYHLFGAVAELMA